MDKNKDYLTYMIDVMDKFISDLNAEVLKYAMNGIKLQLSLDLDEAKTIFLALEERKRNENEWKEYVQKVNKTNAKLIGEIERLKADMTTRKN